MEPDDAQLVALARGGDADSLARLLCRYRSRMYAVAVALLGPGGEVDDVVQDASLVALSRIGSLRDPSAAGSWLTGITRNLCRSRLRARREVPVGSFLVELPAEETMDPAALLDAHALGEWVWRALDGLSDPLRHAVVLRYFTRVHTYEAIAAALGVPVGTVRSRLHEAREALKVRLVNTAGGRDHERSLRQRMGQYAEFFEEYNRGVGCSLLAGALTRDAELRAVGGGPVLRGADAITRALEGDIAAGCRLQPLDVVAGRDITVVEGLFQPQGGDADGVPVLTTQVFFQQGDAITAIRAITG